MEEAEAKILHELTTIKPAMVRLFMADDVTRDLKPGEGKGNWRTLAGIMDTDPSWHRAELFADKAAKMPMGAINREIPEDAPRQPAVAQPEIVQVVHAMKEAQAMIFTEMRDTFGRIFECTARLLETTTERVASLETQRESLIREKAEAIAAVAAAPVVAEPAEADADPAVRPAADQLVLDIGRMLLNKFLKAGTGIDLAKVKEVITKMDPKQVDGLLSELGIDVEDSAEAGDASGDDAGGSTDGSNG